MATTLSFSTPGSFPSTAYGEYNKNSYGNNNACYYYSSGWYRLIFLRQFTLTKAMTSVDLTLAAGAVSGQRYGAGYLRLNHFRCAIYPATTAFDPWPASSASSGNGKKIDTWTYGGSASTSGSLTFTTDSAGNAFTAQTYYVYIWYYREQTANYASSGNITVSGTGTVKTYTLTLPTSVTGATLSTTGAKTVEYGSTYSFTVTLNTGYQNTAPTVKYGSTTLTGTKNGNVYSYTTPAITANTTVTITTTADTYAVTYNKNGHGTAPASQTKTYNVTLALRAFIGDVGGTDTTVTITGNNDNGSSWSGSNGSAHYNTTKYSQTKWNTKSDGSGTGYNSQASYTGNAALTLYAIWSTTEAAGTSYTLPTGTPVKNSETLTRTVTINANGGSYSGGAKTSSATKSYTFKGWFTAKTGGTQRTTSSRVTAAETVYAQYNSSVGSYSAVTLPTVAQCTRSGYTLLGFSTSDTATTATYTPGQSIVPSGDMVLYAVWSNSGTLSIGNGSAWNTYNTFIGAGSAWNKYIAYVGTGSSWVRYK